MALSLDSEIAEALAPMAGAMADATPPAVGDVAARRAMWEPIIGAAGTAQPGPAVLFCHGGGYIFGHIDLFDGIGQAAGADQFHRHDADDATPAARYTTEFTPAPADAHAADRPAHLSVASRALR